jgi:hypothetical protein
VREATATGRGGCIACDRNEEEECSALAAMSQRTALYGRKKDGMVRRPEGGREYDYG